MTEDERDLLAADYVLGTLDAGERRTARALLEGDPVFAAAVRAWEERLAPLAAGIAPVEPPAALFGRIEAALEGAAVAPQPRPVPPEEELSPDDGALPPIPPARPVTFGPDEDVAGAAGEGEPHVDPRARLADAAGPADVIDLTRSLARWRAFAAGAAALAAGLAAVVVIDRLPAPPERANGRYLSVVNRDGSLPALIVDVDTAKGVVTVRPVAAERPADKDLELWAVPEGGQPVSLGVFDPRSPIVRIRPDKAGVIPTRGVFAVSVEPPGGSPTGAPTGEVVYSGPLVPAAE